MKLNESIKCSMKQKLLKEAGEITEEQIAELVTMLYDEVSANHYYDYLDQEEILENLNRDGESWVAWEAALEMNAGYCGCSEIWLYKENNTLKMVISFKLTENDKVAPYANLVATGYDEIKKMIKNLEKIHNEVILPWIESVEKLAKQIKSGKYGRTESLGAA